MRTAIEGALTALPASIPSPSWSGFNIGPITIHAYALCILVGIVAATIVTNVRWNRRHAPEGSIWDIAIWAIPFGIIGGRLYHVFSSPDNYFGPHYDGTGNLWLIPQIWLGGLGIWGAVVLGVVGAWIGCRRSGVKLTSFIDAAAPGLLLAQGLGRWGNYFNQELFGAPTTLPWGLQIDPGNANFPAGYPVDTLFHPTFLYESLWDLLGVAVLLLLDRRFHFRRGRLFWLYAMYYTLGRVWIELLRIDDAEHITFFGITTRLNVWTSILVFVAALVAFLLLTFIRRGYGHDSVLRKNHVDAPSAVGVPAGEGDLATDGRGADDDGGNRDGVRHTANDDDGADDGGNRGGVRHTANDDDEVNDGGRRGRHDAGVFDGNGDGSGAPAAVVGRSEAGTPAAGAHVAGVRDADTGAGNVRAGGARGNVANNQNGGHHVAGTGSGAAGESKD